MLGPEGGDGVMGLVLGLGGGWWRHGAGVGAWRWVVAAWGW